MKIAIICLPHSKSSMVMEAFERAGFELGDVDRRVDEGYPVGRLELWALAKATSGKSKTTPIPKDTPVGDLSHVQVAKCLPAWIPVLKTKGVNYWIALCRNGTVCDSTQYPHDEVLDASQPFDPVEIWERALQKTGEIHGRPTKRGRRRANSRENPAEDSHGTRDSGQTKDAHRGIDSGAVQGGRSGDVAEAGQVHAAGSGRAPHWRPDNSH